MAETIDNRCILVRAFADFDVMPDLLSQTPDPLSDVRFDWDESDRGLLPAIDASATVDVWVEFIADYGPNVDHVEPEDLPDEVPRHRYLANDAWRLADRLGWVTATGLSPAGRRVARIADRPLERRTRSDDMALMDAFSRSIRERYVGGDGLDVAPLLQEGARRLADTDHIWASYIPGLMLVEFEALIHWAFARPDYARRLCEDLVQYRDVAMHRYEQPSPEVDPDENVLLHAEATSRLYLETEELAARTDLTITEVRTTAMLLTFAGLLDEQFLELVNYLVPPGRGRLS